jgi:putative ABC transport system permease protein
VGGAGVLSLTLLSIRERRQEIGLRIAVGARPRDIVLQFFSEAAALAAAGGILGILLGMGIARIVASMTTWDARVSATPILIATLSAAAIGLVSGVLPAWRAAMLDPIEALRTE